MPSSRPGSATAFASIDHIPVVIWEVDVETFRFVYVSQYAETLLGFPIEPWYADENFFWQRIQAADRERVRAECTS